MIIPTSSARILVYSQNYTTFGPSQLAFLSTVRSTLLLDRLSSHFSVQSKAIYFTGLSSLSESPLRALSATHILFWNTTGTEVARKPSHIQSPNSRGSDDWNRGCNVCMCRILVQRHQLRRQRRDVTVDGCLCECTMRQPQHTATELQQRNYSN